jgi:hypothetical protein
MKCVSACVVVLSLVGASKVTGQDYYYGGSSTAGEGYARGAASVIQAQGERNLSNSQAAINLEDAYSKAIDNNVKAANAYYDKKQMHDEYFREHVYAEEQKRATHRARNALPPLVPEEFDRTTGHVNWPQVLQQTQYDQYRLPLDALFSKRAQTGGLSTDDYMQATTATKAWRAKLTSQKKDFPEDALHQIVRFILKLERELNDNLS